MNDISNTIQYCIEAILKNLSKINEICNSLSREEENIDEVSSELDRLSDELDSKKIYKLSEKLANTNFDLWKKIDDITFYTNEISNEIEELKSLKERVENE